jgi:hypothetical protein
MCVLFLRPKSKFAVYATLKVRLSKDAAKVATRIFPQLHGVSHANITFPTDSLDFCQGHMTRISDLVWDLVLAKNVPLTISLAHEDDLKSLCEPFICSVWLSILTRRSRR